VRTPWNGNGAEYGEATAARLSIVEHGLRKQPAAAEPESEDVDAGADLVICTVLGVDTPRVGAMFQD
jgi:hypothetical protein